MSAPILVSRPKLVGRSLALALALVVVGVGVAVAAGPVFAAGAYWRLSARSAPSVLPLAGEQLTGEGDQGIRGEGALVVVASNLGDGNVDGEAEANRVVITDRLPAGLEAVRVEGQSGDGVPGAHDLPVALSCTKALPARELACSFSRQLPPYEQLVMQVTVKSTAVIPSQPVGRVTVSGGGGGEETIAQPVVIAGGATSFGVESYALTPESEDGHVVLAAGSHPFQLTTTFNLNQDYGFNAETGKTVPEAPALQKELSFRLPPGLVGDPAAAPQCPDAAFGALDEKDINSCPDDTAVGVAAVTFNDPVLEGFKTYTVPVFNLPPAPGEPARFGISVIHVPVILDTSVRSGEDYGVNVTVHTSSEAVQILGAQVTLWGAPESPAHDDARGWGCLGSGHWVEGFDPARPCEGPSTSEPAAFLTLPTSCTSLASSVTGSSWSGETLTGENDAGLLTGCTELGFQPSLGVASDEHTASTPTGMTVQIGMPQQGTLDPEDRGEQDIRETTLVLPEGLQVNPGAANGLQACTAAQLGFNEPANGNYQPGLGETAQTSNDDFSAGLGEPTPALLEPPCPQPSKLGTLEIQTPLLAGALSGSVYLAEQDTDPFASPLVLYLVAEEPASKVLVKLAGSLQIAADGQLTSTFKNTPPLPFTKLTLHLFGEHAAQATPAFCGEYHASASFLPWSGGEGVQVSSSPREFQLTAGPGGSACPQGALPFAPSVRAGSSDPQAGAFTQFELALERPDGQQALTGVSVNLPPGLAAVISSVTPCPEPRPGSEWACPPESLVGHATASSGLGGQPVSLPGEVFLTTGYDGAPFGLLVRTLAQSGPFDLGYVDVRSRIDVNPETAAVTITTDPGPHHDQLPTILKGVPAQLKALQVTIDRAGFQFNPTSCEPAQLTTTLTGSEGASAASETHYQPHGCQTLPFSPTLTASVTGHASKADGTTFTVKVTSPGLGQANIQKVELQLPEALPSRQSTLNKACLATVFATNPAGCSAESVIGYATVHTPILKSALAGPAYLVSHGNAAFPDVEFVLQGEGITVILDGKTDIKHGITYSRFESAPDTPFTTFTTVLPAGPHSILAGYTNTSEPYDLCGTTLTMPTTITAHNGAVIEQTTPIQIEGCSQVEAAKTRKLTRAQQLAKALQACRHTYKHAKSKRLACEKRARKAYAAKKARRSTRVRPREPR